jgi:hypothetical protein
VTKYKIMCDDGIILYEEDAEQLTSLTYDGL